MAKNNWFMKAKAKTAKWIDNLGKATIVYTDDKGVYHRERYAISKEEAIALAERTGGKLITFNGKLV